MSTRNCKIVYTVSDIKELLGIGKNKAYELVSSGVFPVRQVGAKKIVPIEGFNKWLNSMDEQKLSQ